MHTILSANREDPSNVRMKAHALRSSVTSSVFIGRVDNC